ncbi:conserved hypothetical protein [Rhodococcus sp. RD6.2]|uniref:hypothetical protein n=1 Tax=Rhodococcus sp. RD6.2 TaxID=260936 RepID=UPI00063B7F41|nr:hypothetical protein [Rhodococcus sp. RD6.2]CRK50442.1 conserved hypothetical protein [Rhodococcus sp. RD6.2]
MAMNGQSGGLDAETLRRRRAVTEAETSLVALVTANPAAGEALSRLVHVIAAEAARTPRFAKALADALTADSEAAGTPAPARPRAAAKPRTRRSKGLLDPFAVYEVSGEPGLRARLTTLDADQLKDIIAEQGMNHDGAAMRWKTTSRLVDRIVERVQARATKGDVLR